MKKLFALALVLLVFVTGWAWAQVAHGSDPLAAYKIDGKWHIIDYNGEEMVKPVEFLDFGGYSSGLFRIRKVYQGDTIWGFMDLQGRFAIPPKARYITDFSEGMAMLVDFVNPEDDLKYYGFISERGELVVPMKYFDATTFREGLAYVMNNDERGYINKRGEFVIKFDSAYVGDSFSEGLAGLSTPDHRFGFIDKNGKLRIPFKFDEIGKFSDGLAKVNVEGFFGYIDTTGAIAIKPAYYFADDFCEGFALVGIPSPNYEPRWGVINKAGKVTCDFQYNLVHNFTMGIATVRKDSSWYFIDQYGNEVIKGAFSHADSFRDGLAWASKHDENKYGYIDPTGKWVILLPKADIYFDLRWNRAEK